MCGWIRRLVTSVSRAAVKSRLHADVMGTMYAGGGELTFTWTSGTALLLTVEVAPFNHLICFPWTSCRQGRLGWHAGSIAATLVALLLRW